jgi:hypothetical protein
VSPRQIVCRANEPDLMSVAAGEAGSATAARVETHVGSCRPCRDELACYRTLEGMIDSLRRARRSRTTTPLGTPTLVNSYGVLARLQMDGHIWGFGMELTQTPRAQGHSNRITNARPCENGPHERAPRDVSIVRARSTREDDRLGGSNVNTTLTRSRSQIAIQQTGAVILAWTFLLSRMIGLGVMAPEAAYKAPSKEVCEAVRETVKLVVEKGVHVSECRDADRIDIGVPIYRGPQGELLEERTEWEAVT